MHRFRYSVFLFSAPLFLFAFRRIIADMERTIILRGTPLSYTLERKRVKNVNLRVRRGEVFVSAPRAVPLAVIESFLRSRADFILGAVERTAAPRRAGGEGLPYLGQIRSLRLEKAARSAVAAEGRSLCVAVPDPEDPALIRRALEKWYRSESERLCRAACERLYPHFAALGVPRPEIRMRRMRSCWGVCHLAKRSVSFNAMLAAVPERCIEYVAAHELTHFLHADHSPAFYAELAHAIPDWKERRAELRTYAPLPESLFGSVLGD